MIRRTYLLALSFVLAHAASALGQSREPGAGDAGTASPVADSGTPPPAPAAKAPAAEAADGGAPPSEGPTPAAGSKGATAPEPVPSAGEEMVVTGSRIKQSSSFSPAAPVQVIDRKELEQTGATNMADVVTYLTVSQGSGFQGAGSQSFGTASINLRGLGEGATLVLLNGRRLPLSAAYNPKGQQFADLSTIPLAATRMSA